MAAMLAGKSRCLPRLLGQFSISRANLGCQKIRNASTLKTLAGGRAVNRLIFTTGSKRVELVCRQNTSVRSFHRTVAVYDDLTVVTSPPFADSITEGDMRWEKAVGDRVAADEMLGEIETDKTAMPVPSPVAGVVEELLVADGDTVTSGIPLCKIRPGGEAAASPPKPAESAKPKAPPPKEKPKPKQESSSSGPIPTSIPPSPPLPTKPIASVSPSSVKPIAAAALSLSSGGGRGETRVKMNRMRLRIAQRLKDSQNECAMLTTFNEIDLSNLMELRSKYKDAVFNKHGVKLGFMSAFLKASAHALQDQPTLNAVIDENEIVYRDYVDISVAVSTPKGLVVPVVRNVETMNFVDIERSINDLGLKARNNELAIEDMDGGTFTISNGGVYGSLFGTPIINPPQSAILGMHAIKDRAVVIGGKIEIRPMMWVALTYDHRLVDGREAVTFLIKIKNAVEDPRMLLLGL